MAKMLYSIGFWVRETGQALDRLGCRLQGSHAFKEELNRHRTVSNLFDLQPAVAPNAFIAPSATVVGDVSIGAGSSVWYGSVLRGDVNSIKIGSGTNLQDGTIVHVSRHSLNGKIFPTIIGDNVTVGHNAILHACTVEDGAFVGMGAVLLDGARVESGAIVAAGALVTQGTVVPSGQVWAGNPAKKLRDVSAAEASFIPTSAAQYGELAAKHLAETSKSAETILADKRARQHRLEHGESEEGFDLDRSKQVTEELRKAAIQT